MAWPRPSAIRARSAFGSVVHLVVDGLDIETVDAQKLGLATSFGSASSPPATSLSGA
jgi:hypothetical protein